MVQMIALADFRYARRDLRAGDAFEASDRDAGILRTVRRARFADDETPSQDRPRRRYRRRDLRAEDSD